MITSIQNRSKRKQTPLSIHLKSQSLEKKQPQRSFYQAKEGHKLNIFSVNVRKYVFEGQIRNCTSNKLIMGRNTTTNYGFAIKRIYQDPQYQNRELDIISKLSHPNIIDLVDHYFTYENNLKYLHLVMPIFGLSFKDYSVPYERNIAKQLFQALAYLDSQLIMHRDIQLSNILYKDGIIKVCDFGSAKIMNGSTNLIDVGLYQYRAPELLFGYENYDSKIDIWSAGCLIVELINGKPLFNGQDVVDQIVEIIKIFGSPTEQERLELGITFKIPQIKGEGIEKYVKFNDNKLIDLLKRIFTYNPQLRLSAQQCLEHCYFKN